MVRVKLFALMLLAIASPLSGQATPSISGREGTADVLRRDVVSLREYIDIRLNSLETKIEVGNTMRQLAIDKAEESINKRLEGVPQTFISKSEFTARADAVDNRLSTLENRFASLDGSLRVVAFVLATLQVVLGAFIAWLFRRRNGHGATKGSSQ